MDTRTAFRPTLNFLSPEGKTELDRAALTVLDEIGMRILHDEAMSLLVSAGCRVEGEKMVKIPQQLVQSSLKSAPNRIVMYDRAGELSMDLGGWRSYFGTGSDLIYSLDSTRMERHPCVLADVARAARVADGLPNIDFIMSFAHPSDFPARRAYLLSFHAMVTHSTKPIVCTAHCREDLEAIWTIAKTVRKGEGVLRDKPYLIHYAEPISPLKHPFDSLDKLLFCAEKGIPVIYSPAPISGSTAPITIAGHVTQGLAESLCGLVIHQLKTPGAPFLMGIGPAVLDMATSQCSYNAPEYLMAYAAAVEMHHYYQLPNWGYAGTSDAQIPDGQAVFESGLMSFIAAMTGSNLNHDVGYLDFGRTGCLDMIVINDETIDQIRRMAQGIPLDEEMLGLDVISEVGADGEFLTQEHTLKHLRSTQWRPKLLSRMGFERWEKAGGIDLLQRAQSRLAQILETHQPVPLDTEQADAIQTCVDQFDQTV